MKELPGGMNERRHGRSAQREAGRSGDKSKRLQSLHGVGTFGDPFDVVKYKVIVIPSAARDLSQTFEQRSLAALGMTTLLCMTDLPWMTGHCCRFCPSPLLSRRRRMPRRHRA